MTSDKLHQNEAREQEQLRVARALIEDATRDITLWLQANPSAKERVHVLAMQERLTELDRIAARQLEHRALPRDGSEWSQTIVGLLSHLENAKQVRGNVVGNGVLRLPDHLPKNLPGRKAKPKVPKPIRPVRTGFTNIGITKAPTPPREVGGRGEGWPTARASQVPHDPPMYFPSDLWPRTNVILLKAQRRFPLQTQTVELCKHIVSEITPLFVEGVKAGKMKAAAVLREHGGGMEDLLRLILVRNDPGPRNAWGLSDEGYWLGEEVRKSDEWLRLAEAIEETPRAEPGHISGPNRLRTGEKQTETNANQQETPHAESSDKTAQAEESKLTGRPRKDSERELVKTLKTQGKSWKDIAAAVNTQTGQDKNPEAYRALFRSTSPNRKTPGKNGQK